MKYFVYELHLREEPFHVAFYGYLIYNKSEEKVAYIIRNMTDQRAARKKCEQLLSIFTQYDESMAVWRNWPILLDRHFTEEDIIQKVKEKEIQ